MTTSGAISRQKEDLAAGTRLGRYRVEEPVGRGGMGTVYSAYDETTNRNVALKLLAPGIPKSLRDRFLAECEAEANIRHEHVMPVYDRGWLSNERPYFVMELLYEPITLGEIVEHRQKGTLTQTHPRLKHWNDLRRLIGDVILPICEGVAVANVEYGVQHRDLKPDNVLIDIRTKRAYLIDFGICREMDDFSDHGKIVGTPRFLSPEQASARTDPRTDVWGLGGLLRYVVTGEPPLAATSPFSRSDVAKRLEALKQAEAECLAKGEKAKASGYAKRRKQLEDPTLRVQEDLLRDATGSVYNPLPESLSAGLAAIIHKAMANSSDDRYENAHALVADLRSWLGGSGVQALTEQGARGAAVDWAKRLLNQNVVRAVGTLVALFLGWTIGTGVFQTTPPPPDHRAEDAVAALENIDKAWIDLTPERIEDAVPPRGLLAMQHLLRRQTAAVDTRLASLGDDAAASEAATVRARIAGRDRMHRLRLEGWHAKDYSVEDEGHIMDSGESMAGAVGTFYPGVYKLYARDRGGLYLRFVVPPIPSGDFAADKDGIMERVVRLARDPQDVPSGMTWVPAGLSEPGGDQMLRAFVAGIRRVTVEKYSEWLDDLKPNERQSRVPPSGFQRDERDPRRWLVTPGEGNKPVVGIKPADAAAYAAWRARVDGVAVRLPTALEWQRMAAIDQLASPHADALFPWRAATPLRARQRTGKAAVPKAEDISAYGVRDLFAGGGEIVTTGPNAFAVKGEGGLLPRASAVQRSRVLASDATDHEFGFRLVVGP